MTFEARLSKALRPKRRKPRLRTASCALIPKLPLVDTLTLADNVAFLRMHARKTCTNGT